MRRTSPKQKIQNPTRRLVGRGKKIWKNIDADRWLRKQRESWNPPPLQPEKTPPEDRLS